MIKRVIWGVGVLAIACGGGDSSELSPETAPSASQSDSSAEGNGASDEVNRTDAVDAATTGADADLEIPVRARDGSGTNAAVSGGGNGSNAALDGRGDGSGSVTPADDPASSSNTGGNDPADGDPADGDSADGDPADGDPADNDPADSDPVSSGADVTEQLLDVETLAHGQFS